MQPPCDASTKSSDVHICVQDTPIPPQDIKYIHLPWLIRASKTTAPVIILWNVSLFLFCVWRPNGMKTHKLAPQTKKGVIWTLTCKSYLNWVQRDWITTTIDAVTSIWKLRLHRVKAAHIYNTAIRPWCSYSPSIAVLIIKKAYCVLCYLSVQLIVLNLYISTALDQASLMTSKTFIVMYILLSTLMSMFSFLYLFS